MPAPASAPPPAILPGRIDFDARGTPCSPEYGDVYHSADGGAAQARHVFLAGNGLPDRWRGRASFTVLETGFGLGMNFLETWRTLRADPRAPERLHYVSIEKHPLPGDALRRAHPGDALAAALLAQWPPPLAGLHRLELDDGRVVLTLALGDAGQVLPRLAAPADAVYLDGFAPARNPDIWTPAVLSEIGRLARPGATVATWTVAAAVREALAAAGFDLAIRPGFGRKRDMLAGAKPGQYAEPRRARRATVIGAGLAGACVAERLAARGWAVTVLEREPGVARGASGNPSGVVQPVLNLADAPNARLSRAAFLYAVRRMRNMPATGFGAGGVLRLARDAAQQARFGQILARLGAPPAFAQCVDATAAAELAQRPVAGPGVWFPLGGWVQPGAVCNASLAAHAGRIELRLRHGVSAHDLALLGRDALLVDATGTGLARVLPVAEVRGQVSYLPPSPARRLAIAVTGDGYVAPMPGGGHCAGASFGHDDTDLSVRAADHADNLARAARMLPGFTTGLDAATLDGRAGLRITTPDRVPAFGRLREGHAVATGLGARGLVWAPLCAEIMAARLGDEPLPVEAELADAISPLRFVAPASRR